MTFLEPLGLKAKGEPSVSQWHGSGRGIYLSSSKSIWLKKNYFDFYALKWKREVKKEDINLFYSDIGISKVDGRVNEYEWKCKSREFILRLISKKYLFIQDSTPSLTKVGMAQMRNLETFFLLLLL